MATSKPERHAQELAVFHNRADVGLQSMRSWIFDRQQETNMRWPDAEGTELAKMQGIAKLLEKLLSIIDNGPTIREAAQ